MFNENDIPMFIKQEKIYIKSKEGILVGFPEYTKDISIFLKFLPPPYNKPDLDHPLEFPFATNTLRNLASLVSTLPQAARDIHGQSVSIQGNVYQVAQDISDNEVKTIVILVTSLVYQGVRPILEKLWHQGEFHHVFLAIRQMDIPSLSNALSKFIAEKNFDLIKVEEENIKRQEREKKAMDAKYVQPPSDVILFEAVQKVTGYTTESLYKDIPKHIYLLSLGVPQQTVADYIGIKGMPNFPGNTLNLKKMRLTGLSGIELIRNSNITSLHLDNNSIIGTNRFLDTPEYPFKELPNLKGLNLNNNQLSSITPNIFDGLINLNSLNLSHNKISYIMKGAFSGLPRLNYLQLNHNKIFTIEIGAFSGLTNIYAIDLDRNYLSEDESTFKERHDLNRVRSFSYEPQRRPASIYSRYFNSCICPPHPLHKRL